MLMRKHFTRCVHHDDTCEEPIGDREEEDEEYVKAVGKEVDRGDVALIWSEVTEQEERNKNNPHTGENECDCGVEAGNDWTCGDEPAYIITDVIEEKTGDRDEKLIFPSG